VTIDSLLIGDFRLLIPPAIDGRQSTNQESTITNDSTIKNPKSSMPLLQKIFVNVNEGFRQLIDDPQSPIKNESRIKDRESSI